MGAIAGPNIIKLMALAMQHDLSARIQSKQDQRMYLSMKTMGLANQKSTMYQALSTISAYVKDENGNQKENDQYKQMNNMLLAIESQINAIERQDKMLDIQTQQLEKQLKIVEQRAESADKLLEKNIEKFAPKW